LIRNGDDLLFIVDKHVLGKCFDALEQAFTVRDFGGYCLHLVRSTTHTVGNYPAPDLLGLLVLGRRSRHPRQEYRSESFLHAVLGQISEFLLFRKNRRCQKKEI
jgi:hypothetical protein